MVLTRRSFLSCGAAITISIGCGGKLVLDRSAALDLGLDQRVQDIIYYASLAPSGHNTQPWLVEIEAGEFRLQGRMTVRLDSSRALPAVDPTLRETCISIGAFIENLVRAFDAYGYSTELSFNEQLDASAENPIVVEIVYAQTASHLPRIQALELMAKRHSDKSEYLDKPICTSSLAQLSGQFPELSCYEKGSTGFDWLKTATLDANIVQAADLAKRAELAQWLRFSDEEATEKADGLPAEQLGLSGIIKTLYYWTTDRESAQSDKFAQQGVDMAKNALDHCAAFFVLTGGSGSYEAVLTGRRVQAFWLAATELGISLGPMSQALEEILWASKIDSELGLEQPAQMLFRAGYVENYGENNRIRRPVSAYCTQL
ncbi:MAG: hypothetical protein LBV04_06870 [Deferribacteraceae bacterium]|jgi:nitroreductase|nr:hypothetical protein [Deferribacteraceae bacterium]